MIVDIEKYENWSCNNIFIWYKNSISRAVYRIGIVVNLDGNVNYIKSYEILIQVAGREYKIMYIYIQTELNIREILAWKYDNIARQINTLYGYCRRNGTSWRKLGSSEK